MTEQDLSSPSLPSKAKMLKEETKKKIVERIEQAKELKISEKAFLIAEQFGKVVKARGWLWGWHDYLFKKGKLWIRCHTWGGDGKKKYKGELLFK